MNSLCFWNEVQGVFSRCARRHIFLTLKARSSGVPCIRYVDGIVLLAKRKRASERLLESSRKYLKEKLKFKIPPTRLYVRE